MYQLLLVMGVIFIVCSVGWTVLGFVEDRSPTLFRAAGVAILLGFTLILVAGMGLDKAG